MILSAPGFVYTDKKIKKTFDYQPVVSSTGLTDTCFVPARARPFQLQMKPGPVRRWPGPAHAGRIVRGSRRRHHRGSDTLSRPRPCADFSCLFDVAAVANLQIARFTTGNNREKRTAPDAPSAACRHADLELCVLGPACSSWTAVKFLARVPRAPDDRKMLKIQDLVSIVNHLV